MSRREEWSPAHPLGKWTFPSRGPRHTAYWLLVESGGRKYMLQMLGSMMPTFPSCSCKGAGRNSAGDRESEVGAPWGVATDPS